MLFLPPPAPLIRVDLAHPGPAISPTMYGVFFEEINHAGDGGLYSELLQNRSFGEGMKGWKTIAGLQPSLTAGDRPAVRVGTIAGFRLENEGYYGVSVRRGEGYRLRIEVRGQAKLPLRAAIENGSGRELASATIPLTREWQMREVNLNALGTADDAKFVLTSNGPADIEFRYVSLMPRETWKGHGLRPDLAQMVADLKPGFVRFPGGCFVEGDSIKNALRWKKTIGPAELRPGRQGVWGYRSSDGLGYHEYLQWCEDMKAEPLYVSNVGMACQYRSKETVPLADLDEWVQDALDAIEYANGPVSSRWGAERAKKGHPKPFGLRFIEVGNENFGPEYEARYARFYDAIRAKYPDMKIIVDVMGSKPATRGADVQDEHFYETTASFANRNRYYDARDRATPKVYVGEYAVTQNAGKGNLRAALGEAAFMIGMERNADQVQLASYAPLFVNDHDRAWNPDAIVFDGSRAYGTPSYWNQWLFGHFPGERSLPTSWDAAVGKVAGRGVGVGTWNTKAEFQDVKLNGETTKLTHQSGTWEVDEDGTLRQTTDKQPALMIHPDSANGDFTLTLKARKVSGAEGFLIPFRVRTGDDFYWWNIGGWGNTRSSIERRQDGNSNEITSSVALKVETGRWVDVRIEGRGDRIRCTLDGNVIHDFKLEPAPEVIAGATQNGKTVIVKVVNLSGDTLSREIRLDGAKSFRGIDETVLTSGSPDDENTFIRPKYVAPVTSSLSFRGDQSRASVPALVGHVPAVPSKSLTAFFKGWGAARERGTAGIALQR